MALTISCVLPTERRTIHRSLYLNIHILLALFTGYNILQNMFVNRYNGFKRCRE